MLKGGSRLSPGQLLLSATIVCVAACLIVMLHVAEQRWLGLDLMTDGQALRIHSVAPRGPSAAIAPGSQLTAIGPIRLEARDLLEEPDFLDTDEQVREFFRRQTAIVALLDSDLVTLTLADENGIETRIEVRPRSVRPLTDLPLVFWFQLFAGSACMLIGAWVWVLRPTDWGARMFALTGLMVPVSSLTAAIYSSRELAYNGAAFRWLSMLNHVGAMIFAAALVALFLCYPRRLVRPRTLLLVPLVFVSWLLADIFHLGHDLTWGFRLPLLLTIVAVLVLVVAQLRLTNKDPSAQAALRWFSLSVLLGCSLYVLTTVASRMLGWLPPLSQGWLFGFLMIVYVGIALGLRRYRLFELDQWAYRILFWVGGATGLVLLDAILTLALQLQEVQSLGISVLVAGFLYLPVRNALWRMTVERRRMPDHELFQSVLEVAFTTSVGEREQAWQQLVRRLFDPLELRALPEVNFPASPVSGRPARASIDLPEESAGADSLPRTMTTLPHTMMALPPAMMAMPHAMDALRTSSRDSSTQQPTWPESARPKHPAQHAPQIVENGLGMILPAVASSPPLLVRYPWRGRELFGIAQVRLADQVVRLMRHADTNREAYERGISEERRRIARDLHDDVGARLLASLQRRDLEATRRTIREAIAEMRITMSGLTGGGLDLGAMLANLRHETAERLIAAGVELDWAPTEIAPGLKPAYRTCKNLVSVHRELVSNVIRHSCARRMGVSIEFADGHFRSIVSDDGVGIPEQRHDCGTHHGLRNLHHRVEELGGELTIESSAAGTIVRIDVPLVIAEALA